MAWDTCKQSRWPQAGRKSEQNSRTPPKASMLCDEGRLRVRICSEPRSSYLAPGTSNELLLLSEPWIPVPLKPVPPLSYLVTSLPIYSPRYEISVIWKSFCRPISRCSAKHLSYLLGFLISTCKRVTITHFMWMGFY